MKKRIILASTVALSLAPPWRLKQKKSVGHHVPVEQIQNEVD